jgi:outer membrane protein, multidrug efflux system
MTTRRAARPTRVLIGLSAIMALAACRVHDVDTTPEPPIPVPEGYSVETRMDGAPPEAWWGDFNDPALARLIDRSLAQNLQLRAAWARLEQARALVRQAGSGKWPQLDASLSASRTKNRFDIGQEIIVETTAYNASIQAGYEVDLWRRVDSLESAAAQDAAALRDNLESIALSTAAQVSETWFDLLANRARRALIESQLEINETYLELTRLRFEQGLASALEVYQQRQQLVATRAQLALIDGTTEVLEHALSLLVGQPPGARYAVDRTELPALPALPATGVPADLLERRPDVRAARRQVVAADYRLAAAIADRLPALRLSGSLSEGADNVGDLFRSPLWSIVGSLTAPLFDGGRRAAEVDRNEAVVEELRFTYAFVLLQAMVEVENALVQERQQVLYIADLSEQLELAEATLREARARYRQGLVDYLQVLTALQSLQQVEVTLLGAQRQLISYRIQLCRALGGTWTRDLEPPAPLASGGDS